MPVVRRIVAAFANGSVHSGLGTGKHEVSRLAPDCGSCAKSTSSACGTPYSVPEAITWRTSLGEIGQADPSTRRQVGCGWSLPFAIAFSAAETIRPAMPAPRPVASDEHDSDGIATVTRDEKFVQP